MTDDLSLEKVMLVKSVDVLFVVKNVLEKKKLIQMKRLCTSIAKNLYDNNNIIS